MTDHQLFIKVLSRVEKYDYGLALEKHKNDENAARFEIMESFPTIAQRMEAIRPAEKTKIKKIKAKPDGIDFIRDLHWVYETMGLEGAVLAAAKKQAPSGGALAQLKRAMKSETYADRILNQIRSLEMSKQKMEAGAKKQVTNRMVLDTIERCLTQANEDAGVLSQSTQGDDSTVDVSPEPDPASGERSADSGAIVAGVQA